MKPGSFDSHHVRAYAYIAGTCLLAFGCGGPARVKLEVVREKPNLQVAEGSKPEPTLAELAAKAMEQIETFLRREDLPPSLRAQAMFRLAALHDDRAAEKGTSEEAAKHREAAIVLYTQIIRDFSETEVAPPSRLFLGYDLHAVGRIPQAQHVFRSLVCQNHFALIAPKEPSASLPVKPLPQAHDDAYWKAWETNHPVPLDKVPKTKKKTSATPDPETVFVNPYPADCSAVSGQTPTGEVPRYVGHTWWEIGESHFNQLDPSEGPYSFNLAAAAYQHAVRYGNAAVRPVAIYKLAWTYFKQQRYEAAVEQFVILLRERGEKGAQTSDTAGDLRKEACTYIAGSLTYVDFRGPAAEDPFIPREDVLDRERDPRMAEEKMHVAIDRLRNPKVIPQDEPWTSDIYAALILEFRELNQWRNMIETSELFLAKWPTDPRADEMRKGLERARSLVKNTSGGK